MEDMSPRFSDAVAAARSDLEITIREDVIHGRVGVIDEEATAARPVRAGKTHQLFVCFSLGRADSGLRIEMIDGISRRTQRQ
jgi:hypothetical protein